MAEQQKCKKLAAVFVEHQEYFGVISDENCQWAIQNPKDAITLFADAVKNRATTEVKKLLKFIRTVSLPAIGEFVVAEKLREGETVGGIKVAWLGKNFKKNFLTKREEAVPESEFREHELTTRSRDPAIITELGGEDKVETTFGQFWEFLKTADRALWHVRHIRDVNGVLWAVGGGWYDDGLNVGAVPLDSPSDWGTGRRFLSR